MVILAMSKVIGHGAFWSLLNQLAGQLLTLIVFLITARFLSKEVFGYMATAMLCVEIFRQVVIESIGTVFVAKRAPTDRDYSVGFTIIFIFSCIASILLFFSADLISNIFSQTELKNIVQLMALVIFILGLSKTHEIRLTKEYQFKSLAFRSILSITIGGAIGIFLATEGYGVLSLVAQQIITSTLSLAFLWSVTKWRPSFYFDAEKYKDIFKSAKFIALNAVAGMAGGQSDVFLTSYYLGAANTGVYNSAKRLFTAAVLVICTGLNNVALPVFSDSSESTENLKRVFYTAVRLTSLLTAPLFLGLAVLSDDFVNVLLGAKWSEAAPVLAILSLTGYTRSITQYCSNITLVLGKVHWQTILGFVDAAVNVILLMIFARYGIISVAAAFVFKSLMFVPIITAQALFLLRGKFKEYLFEILPSLAVAIAMAVIIFYLKKEFSFSAIYNLFLYTSLGAFIYTVGILIASPHQFSEVRAIASAFKKS